MEPAENPYDIIIEAFVKARIPRDLLACELWLLCAILSIYLPFLNESFLRVIFGIPLVLFIPGYALIAALFPAAKDLDGIERVALSFGLSIAVVPLTGLALNYSPWGIRLDPIIICLSILTIGLCLVAQYRRAALVPEDRFEVPFAEMKQAVRDEFFPREETSRIDRILSLLLLVAIIAAVLTTVYVIVVPKEGEKFTEFFILGEKQKAADYPDRLIIGKNSSLFIGIGNHEYRPISYTVETYLMNMTFDEATNTSTVTAMKRLDRFTVPVAHNQTVIQPYTFVPDSTNYNRLEFLLFNETVLDDQVQGMDRINQSYRDLHLWVSVRSR
ncbi:MAG: DUF1616 domain-containing protein [Methanomicrobiales archaeon]|nr:DUF1616 domain-containing protein [Methanomicrobiales archaeon]